MPKDHDWFIKALQKLEAASPKAKEPMTDEEVFEISVQIVSQRLISEGAELIQVNTSLNSVPTLWFKQSNILSYIVITTARYPDKPKPPSNTHDIQFHLAEEGANGYWVGVALAHEFEVFDPEAAQGMPLMKGFGVLPAIADPVSLKGL